MAAASVLKRHGENRRTWAPIAHVRGDGFAGFVKLHRNVAGYQMRRSRKADGSAADDGDRQIRIARGAHAVTFVLFLGVAAAGRACGGRAIGSDALAAILGQVGE